MGIQQEEPKGHWLEVSTFDIWLDVVADEKVTNYDAALDLPYVWWFKRLSLNHKKIQEMNNK